MKIDLLCSRLQRVKFATTGPGHFEMRLSVLDIYYACKIPARLIRPSTGPPLVEIEGEGDHAPPGAAPSRTTCAA